MRAAESALPWKAKLRMEVKRSMHISEVMKPDGVRLGISVSTKPRLLKFLAQTAAAELDVAEDEILGSLLSREALGSTGIGSGVALPHAEATRVVSPFALLIRLADPIEFEAVDEEPVDLVCLILTPPTSSSTHLQLLSSVTRQLRAPDVITRIRSATDHAQAYEAFVTPRN